MYITGQHRYDNYTSRYDVYLFTLRDYSEVLLDKFNGRYVERSDMPIHSGYLLEFVDYVAAKDFITALSESHEEKGVVTTYVLPHLEGNDLPLYATTAEGTNVVYIGLSEYEDALAKYIGEVVTISFDENGATGSVESIQSLAGNTVIIPDSTGLEYEGHSFKEWNTSESGDGESYAPGDTMIVENNITLYAIWIED